MADDSSEADTPSTPVKNWMHLYEVDGAALSALGTTAGNVPTAGPLRTATSSPAPHRRALLQRRWSVHDGLFFAKHIAKNEPHTLHERLWLLRCSVDQPRGILSKAPAPACADPRAAETGATVDIADDNAAHHAAGSCGHRRAQSCPRPPALPIAAFDSDSVEAATTPSVSDLPLASDALPPPAELTAAAGSSSSRGGDASPPSPLSRTTPAAAPLSASSVDASPPSAAAAAQADKDEAEAALLDDAEEDTTGRELPERIFKAACNASDTTSVRRWLRAGGDINAREAGRGWTLLMGAAVCENNWLLCELLQRGASPEVEQKTGSTALALAAMQGSQRAVEHLIAADADVNSADEMGVTPFMAAAIKGHHAIAGLLRKQGARSVSRVGEHITRVRPLQPLPTIGASASGSSANENASAGAGTSPQLWGVTRAYNALGSSGASLRSTVSSGGASNPRERGGGTSRGGSSSRGSVGGRGGAEQQQQSPGGASYVRPGDVEDADARARALIEEEELEKASGRSSCSSSCGAPSPRARSKKNKVGRAKTR